MIDLTLVLASATGQVLILTLVLYAICPLPLDQGLPAGWLPVLAQCLTVYAQLEPVHGQMLLTFFLRPILFLLEPSRIACKKVLIVLL